MGKAWEGSEIFKTQRNVARVPSPGGSNSLYSIPGELQGSREGTYGQTTAPAGSEAL